MDWNEPGVSLTALNSQNDFLQEKKPAALSPFINCDIMLLYKNQREPPK